MKTGKAYNMDLMDKTFLVPLHCLGNIEITKYFNYKHKFNGVYSRENLPRIKDGAYVINLNDKVKEPIGFHDLLTETQLYTLILLEFNVFLKMY